MHHLLLLEIKQFGLVTKLGKAEATEQTGITEQQGRSELACVKNSSGISEPDVSALFEYVLFNGLQRTILQPSFRQVLRPFFLFKM